MVARGSERMGMVARGGVLRVFFAAALFGGAFLYFWIQPLFGKTMLPPLGGGPSVWNACLVFYQGVLIAGYYYSYRLARLASMRKQAGVHAGFAFAAAGAALWPFAFDDSAAADRPVPWLMWRMTAELGLPMLFLASAGPLLQHWLSRAMGIASRDPYHLYAASNAGSFLALLGYPFLVEPNLGLSAQYRLWSLSVAGFALAIAATGLWLAFARGEEESKGEESPCGPPPAWRARLEWLALSAAPSCLLMGASRHIATDVSPFPLLWVAPLSLYLLTFVAAFSRGEWISHSAASRAQLVLLAPPLVLLAAQARPPLWLGFPVHLGAMAVNALVLHQALARRRPDAAWLTEYYLWIALGGFLGGAAMSLAAPLVFKSVLEYPLAIMAVFLVRLFMLDSAPELSLRASAWLLLAAMALVPALAAPEAGAGGGVFALCAVSAALIPALFAAARSNRSKTAFAAASFLLLAILLVQRDTDVLYRERSFFGTLAVVRDPESGAYLLQRGSTLHGAREADTEGNAHPAAYYAEDGPVGDIFRAYFERMTGPASRSIAVFGLGTGTMAWYGRPGDTLTFYEIDPAVVRVAGDPRFFRYLSESRAEIRVAPGDARIRLREAPEGAYGLIVMDVFNSDDIPTHLLTREAAELYKRKLAPGGLLAFHIGMRHVNLEPVIANMARATGMAGWIHTPAEGIEVGGRRFKSTSAWAAMSASPAMLEPFEANPDWLPLPREPGIAPWTDDYSNLWDVLKRSAWMRVKWPRRNPSTHKPVKRSAPRGLVGG